MRATKQMDLFQQPANSWNIELQCPQCGAPVTLEEADRILACAYCRVRLILIYPGYPHYVLAPYQDQKSVQDLIYIPYWRFRGLAFAGLQSKREDRFIDDTFLAAATPVMPPRLGLQTRAFRVRPLSFQKKGRFLQPQFSFETAVTQVTEETFSPSEEETPVISRPVFIGETISLVYAPVFIQEGIIFDGLGDRLLGKAPKADFEKLPVVDPEGSGPVRFLPVICPYCGVDLQGEKDTQVLLCRNCDRAWDFSQGELKKMDFGIMEAAGDERPPYYLPFWRIKAYTKGWSFPIQPAITRPAQHSGPSRPGEGKKEPFYWLPAFKLSPSVFLNISKAVCFRQPLTYQLLEKIPKGQYYPVTLPWEQATEGLKAVIADILKTHPVPRISQIKIELSDHLLVFIPFHLQGNELVQETMSVGISQNALHFGRFL
jgi:DNA-directed RNA polymerase subunit RPC12/RpoP